MRAWFSSLGDVTQRVVKVVIAAGAVATSIGAIVALWPDPDPPPAVLDASFSEITVDEDIPLGEFKARDEELDGSAARDPAGAQLAAITLPEQGPTVTRRPRPRRRRRPNDETTETTETTDTTETTESDDPRDP